MRAVEASTEVPSTPGDVWDFMWAEGGPPRFLADMHRLGYWRDVTAVDQYELRADGTPRYRMSRRLGPGLPAVGMTSVYDVFERPSRAVNHVVDTPSVATSSPPTSRYGRARESRGVGRSGRRTLC